MNFDTVIKNGTVVTAVTTTQADIGIQGEKIAAIGQNLEGNRELDASGKLIVPGAVDIHVHLEMPIGNFRSTDDFLTGTRAAAFGGTTAIVDFIETQPEQTMVEALQARRALADGKTVLDYGLHMTITPTDIPKLDQLPEVATAGCTTFKLYMAYGHRLNDGELLKAFKAIKAVNGLAVIHAENWDVICALIEENLANGRISPHWHPRSRPEQMEGEAVHRVIKLAEMVGLPIHIFHVSCDTAVQEIKAARARGLPVTGETCPQYLYLTQELYDRPGVEGALPICSPPLRPKTEQEALWNALQNNDLQLVSTDHCPFTIAEKATGLQNYSHIPGGVPSIEMRLAGIYQGVVNGRLSLNQWVNLCCTTPAKLVGFHQKGHIGIGYDADLVIFDPNKQKTLATDQLHESADWTPYEGLSLKGWPETTIRRGQILVEQGRFIDSVGNGRFTPTNRFSLGLSDEVKSKK